MAEARIEIPPEPETPETEGPQPETRKTAIALRYNADKDKAPLILATGRGPIAEEIMRVAEENQIPLYEDPELAQLLGKLELEAEIPPELYVLVAEVLFFVYQLDRMAEKRERLITRMREEKQK